MIAGSVSSAHGAEGSLNLDSPAQHLFREAVIDIAERAKGVLQRDFGLDEESAYRAMQRESRQRRKSMRDIAEAILLNDDLRKSRWPAADTEKEQDPSSAT